MPQDAGAATDQAKEGRIPFQHGQSFTQGQRMGTGQCAVKRYNRQLRDLIITGTLQLRMPGRRTRPLG
jgi:glutathione-independent formaldehyde dehydrogenase